MGKVPVKAPSSISADIPAGILVPMPDMGIARNKDKDRDKDKDKNIEMGLARSSCPIKAKIMDAASGRFTHYGYGKTTIADIAQDCQMSPGNIYRYFESKVDIASAITHDAGVQVLTELHGKINQAGKARDRLRVFLFDSLRSTYRQLEKTPRFADMARHVREARPEVRRKIRRMERRLLSDILKYGRKTGEFRIDCVQSAARIVQCLVSRFRWPQMQSPHAKLARLETELEGTLAMISTALGAGCLLGTIMRDHPKDKDFDEKIANKANPIRQIKNKIKKSEKMRNGGVS